MRLSANKTDPGWREDVWDHDVEVFCDGALVDRCVTADEEEGFATFFTGEIAKGGDRLETATVRGKVEIRGIPLTS